MILTPPAPPPPPTTSNTIPVMNSNNNLVLSFFSDNRSIMVAAIIFLALVIIFILLIHIYARWFLIQARQTSATNSVTLPQVISPVHTAVFADDFSKKGIDSTLISSIPLFVYKVDHHDQLQHNKNGLLVLECAICLSFFEEDEIGRKLPICGHAYHVNCIDMWLYTHATCPVCRGDIIFHLANIIIHHDSNNENLNQDIMSTDERVVVPLQEDDNTILEIVVDAYDVLPSNTMDENVSRRDSSLSMCLLPSSSMSSSSDHSFKKVVSRSRSETQRKVHPSMDLQ